MALIPPQCSSSHWSCASCPSLLCHWLLPEQYPLLSCVQSLNCNSAALDHIQPPMPCSCPPPTKKPATTSAHGDFCLFCSSRHSSDSNSHLFTHELTIFHAESLKFNFHSTIQSLNKFNKYLLNVKQNKMIAFQYVTGMLEILFANWQVEKQL